MLPKENGSKGRLVIITQVKKISYGKCHVWRHKNKSIFYILLFFMDFLSHLSSHPSFLDVFLWHHTWHFPYLHKPIKRQRHDKIISRARYSCSKYFSFLCEFCGPDSYLTIPRKDVQAFLFLGRRVKWGFLIYFF